MEISRHKTFGEVLLLKWECCASVVCCERRLLCGQCAIIRSTEEIIHSTTAASNLLKGVACRQDSYLLVNIITSLRENVHEFFIKLGNK